MTIPTVRLIDPRDSVSVPWGNGLGSSREILGHYGPVGPDGKRPLLWRMSTTEIVQSCPFSDYAGYARCITLLSEDGFDLEFSDEGARTTAHRFTPTPFSGGWKAYCILHGRPAFVLNVMTLDGAARCSTGLLPVGHDTVTWPLTTAQAMIYCAQGVLRIDGLGRQPSPQLIAGQTLSIGDGVGLTLQLHAEGTTAKAIVVAAHTPP